MGYRGIFGYSIEPAVEEKINHLMENLNGVTVDKSAFAKYKIPTLVKIAAKLEHIISRQLPCKYPIDDLGWVRRDVLHERKTRLDKKCKWTNANKTRFLQISDRLLEACEEGWQEAMEIKTVLESWIKRSDSSLKDYDIDVNVCAYPKIDYDQELVIAEYLGKTSIQHMNTTLQLGADCYDYKKAPKEGYKISIMIDKDRNWNCHCLTGLEGIFDNDYICYAIHEMLTNYWSFVDILSVEDIWVDVKVIYRYHIMIPNIEQEGQDEL